MITPLRRRPETGSKPIRGPLSSAGGFALLAALALAGAGCSDGDDAAEANPGSSAPVAYAPYVSFSTSLTPSIGVSAMPRQAAASDSPKTSRSWACADRAAASA
ncbi:hypothetical protein SUDANB54_02892 [Streptomyces sp. enrichment culture]